MNPSSHCAYTQWLLNIPPNSKLWAWLASEKTFSSSAENEFFLKSTKGLHAATSDFKNSCQTVQSSLNSWSTLTWWYCLNPFPNKWSTRYHCFTYVAKEPCNLLGVWRLWPSSYWSLLPASSKPSVAFPLEWKGFKLMNSGEFLKMWLYLPSFLHGCWEIELHTQVEELLNQVVTICLEQIYVHSVPHNSKF